MLVKTIAVVTNDLLIGQTAFSNKFMFCDWPKTGIIIVIPYILLCNQSNSLIESNENIIGLGQKNTIMFSSSANVKCGGDPSFQKDNGRQEDVANRES